MTEESMISLCQANCTIIHLKVDGTNDFREQSSDRVMFTVYTYEECIPCTSLLYG